MQRIQVLSHNSLAINMQDKPGFCSSVGDLSGANLASWREHPLTKQRNRSSVDQYSKGKWGGR